jgi:hypothetical protein
MMQAPIKMVAQRAERDDAARGASGRCSVGMTDGISRPRLSWTFALCLTTTLRSAIAATCFSAQRRSLGSG